MTGKNKFGFGPLDTPETDTPRRDRPRGPMATAVRETAGSLQETTEAKVAQRRQNAEDAKAFRAAQDEGRVLSRLAIDDIATDDLPRDRLELEAVASSDEMEELKTSIRERGQKEPIEVFIGVDGRYQLKKGWRRLTALTQLHQETGEPQFGTVLARVEAGTGARINRYIDMVEENVVREDLSFAEMAQVAITAAEDAGIDEVDAAELVPRLYGALHKTKRSYIRSFVVLLHRLGDDLMFPKAVSRNLGVDVARALRTEDQVAVLRDKLSTCRSADAQNRVLTAFVVQEKQQPAQPKDDTAPKRKFEFYVGRSKATAREGEFRIMSDVDYTQIQQDRLKEAVEAFERALTRPRIR